MKKTGRPSRSIPPVRWHRGIVGEATILAIARMLRSIAASVPGNRSQDIESMPDGTLATTFRQKWEGGEATVVTGSELIIDGTPTDSLTIEHPIGTMMATRFTLIEEMRLGESTYADARTTARRIGHAADIMERAVRQDPRRLAGHESAAAAAIATLGAGMTAFVPGKRHGSVILPGPYGAFTFDCQDANADLMDRSAFERIVGRAAFLAPRSVGMSATMRGERVEIRLGPTRDRVLRTDPIETIRILAAIENDGHEPD